MSFLPTLSLILLRHSPPAFTLSEPSPKRPIVEINISKFDLRRWFNNNKRNWNMLFVLKGLREESSDSKRSGADTRFIRRAVWQASRWAPTFRVTWNKSCGFSPSQVPHLWKETWCLSSWPQRAELKVKWDNSSNKHMLRVYHVPGRLSTRDVVVDSSKALSMWDASVCLLMILYGSSHWCTMSSFVSASHVTLNPSAPPLSLGVVY